MTSDRSSLRDGKVLMFRDVSDVERAQAEVRASEALLRTLIDHSVNGILRLRWLQEDGEDFRKLRCIFANAMAGRFLNAEREELVDCTGEQLVKIATNGMESEDSEEIVEDFRRATDVGDNIDVEVRHTSGGSNKWLRMICEPFGTDIALTFVDITDGKAKEQHSR
jgi:PAS domain-containing protein